MKMPFFAPAIIIFLLITVWPVGLLALIVYLLIWPLLKSHEEQARQQRAEHKEFKELKHQREIEKKEIDMVRKSNEILLHLIQDEHREEDR